MKNKIFLDFVAILNLSKILLYDFTKILFLVYYMDTNSLVIQTKGLDFCKDTAEDVIESRYHTSSYKDKNDIIYY